MNKNYEEKYMSWIENDNLDEELRETMETDAMLLSKSKLLTFVERKFYKDLQFGTAGLRGTLGYGTNHMNVHTVAKVSESLAQAVLAHGGKDKGVVIGYDVRYLSEEFANVTASVLANHGIKVFLFKEIAPTPLVSYAVRELGTQAGVMITASHNPSEYNGYKVYWEDGIQITDKIAEEISERMNSIEDIFSIKYSKDKIDSDLIKYLEDNIYNMYKEKVLSLCLEKEENLDKSIGIVYTPLSGVGRKYVKDILTEKGFMNLHLVSVQEYPDPDFSNTQSPNPEDEVAYHMALELAEKVNADLIIATDPDADRLGVMVYDKGEYVLLNGNQLGAIIADYILSYRLMNDNLSEELTLVNTIATDRMVEKIASRYGVNHKSVHVGFKNIYSLSSEFAEEEYLFGFEESLGFGISDDIAGDKDAISAALIVAEIAAYLKTTGRTLVDYYNRLSLMYGVHLSETISISMQGINGARDMEKVISNIRVNPINKIGSESLVEKIDYLKDETEIGKENVILLEYELGTWILIRPSGTEPKLKVYIHSSSRDRGYSEGQIEQAKSEINKFIEKALK